MRISDWSSDVCSSDLQSERQAHEEVAGAEAVHQGAEDHEEHHVGGRDVQHQAEHAFLRVQVGQHPAPGIAAMGDILGQQVSVDRVEQEHAGQCRQGDAHRSEEHTSELQSLMRISYAVFCLKKKNINWNTID